MGGREDAEAAVATRPTAAELQAVTASWCTAVCVAAGAWRPSSRGEGFCCMWIGTPDPTLVGAGASRGATGGRAPEAARRVSLLSRSWNVGAGVRSGVRPPAMATKYSAGKRRGVKGAQEACTTGSGQGTGRLWWEYWEMDGVPPPRMALMLIRSHSTACAATHAGAQAAHPAHPTPLYRPLVSFANPVPQGGGQPPARRSAQHGRARGTKEKVMPSVRRPHTARDHDARKRSAREPASRSHKRRVSSQTTPTGCSRRFQTVPTLVQPNYRRSKAVGDRHTGRQATTRDVTH